MTAKEKVEAAMKRKQKREEQIKEIREFYDAGYMIHDIALHMGLSESTTRSLLKMSTQ